jgi:filamin
LSIIWAERQIRGSPFKVNVLPNIDNNYSVSRVICSGDGLQMGIIGKETKCLIDTRTTNPGKITASCQGINKKASCRLLDHRDGTFTLFIKPEETGKHILTIKYNGINVPGSPFTVKVGGPLDASKY